MHARIGRKPPAFLRRACVALVLAWLCLGGCVATAAAQGATAKARLAEARALAVKWQPDAVLVTLSALQTREDGTAGQGLSGWVYTFHSKRAGKWIGIHVGPKGLERQDLPAGMTTPVPADFVDSDKVLPEVRKHGFRPSGDTLLNLTLVGDRNLKTGVYWCATSGADVTPQAGIRSWCIEPKSGKFAARLAGSTAAATQAAAPKAAATLALDASKCGGFAASDAASHLGVPASQVKPSAEKVSEQEWKCTYTAGSGKALSFTIAAAPSVKEAEARMAKYTASLKDDYTELLMKDGMEGVWSNAAATLTVRRGNIIVRTLQPAEKAAQARLAQAVMAKL